MKHFKDTGNAGSLKQFNRMESTFTSLSETPPKKVFTSPGNRLTHFRKFLTLCIIMLASFSQQVKAGLVTIGAAYSYSSSLVGLYAYYKYTSGESIYTPAEVGGGGMITTFALNKYSGTSTSVVDSVYIYMKETSSSSIPSTPSVSGYTLVYSGDFINSTSSGWQTVTLTTPFAYTGAGYLDLLIVRHNGTAMTSGYPNYYYDYSSTGGTPHNYYYTNSDYWTGWGGSSAAATSSYSSPYYRPQIQITVSPFAACSGKPTAGTAIASTTTACPGVPVTFSLSGSTLSSAITYAWDTSSTGTSGWVTAGTSTTFGGIWPFTPPAGRTLYYRCRATCGTLSDTSTKVAVTVGTALAPPYTETFESATPGTNIPCAQAYWNNTTTGAFSSVTTYYGLYYWQLTNAVYSGYSGTNHTPGGANYLVSGYYMGSYSGYPAGYWFTPGITLTAGKTYRFSYWYRVTDYTATYGSSYGYSNIGMYYNTAQSLTGLTAVKPDLVSVGNATYAQSTGDFSVPTTGTYYMALMAYNKYYGYYGGAVFDDLSLVELPPCNTATTAAALGSGPSGGGHATSSPSVACSVPSTITLNVSGTPAFSGLAFSWEYSYGTTAGPWIKAGISALTGTFSVPTGGTWYFRCKDSCTTTGLSIYSDTVAVLTTPITPPYTETFETGTRGVNMPCAGYTSSWSSGAYWYLQNSPYASYAPGITNHTPGGTNYLHAGYYLGYGVSGNQYWFTPGLALTAAKAYNVSFWFSNSAYSTSYAGYGTNIGVRAGTAQTAAAMTIMAGADSTVYINATTSATYNQFQRSFIAPTTGTYYVGIMVNHSYYNYYGMAIDDIGINQLPSCNAKPVAGTTVASPSLLCSSTATSTLSLVGTSAASDLTFQWQSKDPTTGLVTTITGATLPAYTTTTPAAKMYYRCIVTCPLITGANVDTSSWVLVGVTPITLPYVETFETGTAGVNMPCAGYTYSWGSAGTYWNLLAAPISGYSWITNHTPGGSKYLSAGYYIGSYGSGATQYWFTPGLSLFANKAYQVSYWFNGSGYSSGNTMLGVAAGTSQTAAAMTIAAGVDTTVNTTTYTQLIRNFISPTTGTYYVGIKVNNLVYSYPGVAIDDIGIIQLPSCNAKPVAGTTTCSPSMICSSGTTTCSLVGTTAASDLSFQWYDVTGGIWTSISGATSPTYTTPTLSASKSYRCVVTCLASATPNTDTSSLLVVPVGAIIPPYTETFEAATIGTNVPCASYTYSWGSAGYYWYLQGSTFGSYYPAVYNHTPGGSKYLSAGTYIGTYGSGAAQYWFSPAIKFTAGATYEGSYWYTGSGYSGGSTTLGLYYGTAQTAAAMTTPLLADVTGINTSTYQQIIGRFVAPTTGNYYLGIKVNHTAYSYPGVAIDDIGLTQLPPCTGAPTVGTISASPYILCTAGTVSLTMDLGGVSKVAGLSYQWYDSSASTGGAWVAIGSALTAPTYSLSISTTTWFKCVVTCTATSSPTTSSVISVNVGAVTPPYKEDFEKSTSGTNVPCASYSYSFGYYYYWNTMNSPLTYGPTALDNHTPGGSKYLIGGYYIGYPSYSGYTEDYWLSPAVTLTAGKRYQISYWYNTDGYAGANYKCGVYMGTTQSKAGMTTLLGTVLNPTNTTYKQYKYQFVATTTGNVYFGIMKGATGFGYGMAFDDIGVDQVPPCSAPVVAGTISADPLQICSPGGTTSLDLIGSTLATGLTYTWQDSNSTTGGAWATFGSSAPPTTSISLTEKTWIRCIVTCAATGATSTSNVQVIGVGAYDLPYAENFEGSGRPTCSDATFWGASYYDGWNVVTGDPLGVGYSNHTPGGKKELMAGYYMGSYGYYTPLTDENYWFTPGLNMRAGYKYELSFWYQGYSSYNQKAGAKYGTSQTAGGMTNVLMPLQIITNSAYKQFDTTFKISATGVYYFGLQKSVQNLGTWTYYGVTYDDININYAPCDGLPFSGGIIGTSGSGTALCAGTPVTLTDTGATIPAVPGIKYQWQYKGLGTGTPTTWTNMAGKTDTILSGTNLVGYQYRLAVICNNTHDSAFTSAYQVPALPAHPPVYISPSSSPINYCLGDTVKLNATSFSSAVYQWTVDSVVIPGWTFSDMGATKPGWYMVKVSSPLSPCPAYSTRIKLQATDPGYSVTITTPTDSIICAGNSVVLTAIASKGGVTYQWRKDNIIIPGATSSTLVVSSATGTGYYSVTAFDGVSTCAAISRTILMSIKPNPPAVITPAGGSLTACAEVGVLLNASTGGYTYEWTHSGSTIVGWTDSSELITNSGVYTVKVRTSDGCVTVSSPVTVNILPSPTPVIVKTVGSGGTPIVLSTSSATYLSYKWIRNGGSTPDATTPTDTITRKGTYKVIVTDVNGCTGESIPMDLMDDVLSIGNVVVNGSDIKVYPNPTESRVFIESPVSVKLEIKDAAGKTVYTESNVSEVDMSKFADGVYLFMISDKTGKQLLKEQRVNKISAK